MRNLPYPTLLSKHYGLAAAILSGSLVLGGCAQISSPLASYDGPAAVDVTGSTNGAGTASDLEIDTTDRAVIALALTRAPVAGAAVEIPWLNPESGNSGTITALGREGEQVPGCMAFQTTANTIQGVKAYSGNACRDLRQELQVIGIAEAAR
ncbi:pyridoxamine 5'-phosphate oxidase [Microvirga tunisiensis]|uniref:Pyridoxamine 5'-phosphate oxidase n=2 Tax=Pannonibacter tanglangensis TaxID=2750084 RepID=A0ABW9ZHI4_9HYPH|nr:MULTISPECIES: RT0821/Lpp0805 family surface protein [unclassified Pannonibacter]NBN64317.1 pyridoxamine 5'-phosphate oxidase [Pannonibacter sp. XCT-34]NBN78850.1 pyridoxamine 5'-phosphate oxidase [Pannonibacter sp. XCT-53]